VIVIFFLLISFAGADQLGQQVCNLKGEIVLSGPTEIFCMKDMKIADGTHIVTQGYPLTMTAVGSIVYGEPPAKGERPARYAGLRISSFKAPAPQSHAAGPIYIYGHTSFGNLEIRNRGASEKDLSGEVMIEYVTRGKSYTQTVDVAPGTKVDLVVNGFRLEPNKGVAATVSESDASESARAASASDGKAVATNSPPPPKAHKRPIRRPRPPARRYEPPPSPYWIWRW
jgi:hypothetical protein